VKVRDKAAFEEMKAHILDLYDGIRVKHSFIDDGHYVDCVPIERPLGVQSGTDSGPAASPPREPHSASTRLQGTVSLTLKPGKRDVDGNEMYCRPKTTPMRRVSLEEMIRYPTLQDFLRPGKQEDDGSLGGGGTANPADSSMHYYARGVQLVDNYGGEARLNVWNPSVSAGMSLSQIWVVGGDGTSKQTVEAGWQVDPVHWKTNRPVLFVFYTSRGYGDGCYHPDCRAFVPYGNNAYIGKALKNFSSKNGNQFDLDLEWLRDSQGNWWLSANGRWLGYYPKSLFGSGALSSKATKIAFGGETAGDPTSLEMGSGEHASQGLNRAAYQRNISYFPNPTTTQSADLQKYEPNPSCYTARLDRGPKWGTYLFFGGPGCTQGARH
jgi:hypothetical protein